jgi:hypothetical protein
MIHLAATSIGPIAAELFAAHREIEVIAAFERSFYLMCHGGLVCVGVEGIGRGPINVTLEDAEKIDWRDAGVFHEVKGEAGPGRLVIGDDVTIRLDDTPVWQPPAWAPYDRGRAERGVTLLRQLATDRAPDEGLAALVFAPGSNGARTPTARAASAQMAALAAGLPAMLRDGRPSPDLERALTLLLGLGTGLTPSGDDVIGGVFLALTALGRAPLRDALWAGLASELGDLTTEISAMHLSAAADGLGAEAVHALANAMLAGDRQAIPGQLERVGRIGHTSGWDTVTGFALTLAAALHGGHGATAA